MAVVRLPHEVSVTEQGIAEVTISEDLALRLVEEVLSPLNRFGARQSYGYDPSLRGEGFVDSLVQRETGVSLDAKQWKFLGLIIGQGIIFKVTKESLNDPQCQLLIDELFKMQRRGLITSLSIVYVP